jgi:hypothetical protein
VRTASSPGHHLRYPLWEISSCSHDTTAQGKILSLDWEGAFESQSLTPTSRLIIDLLAKPCLPVLHLLFRTCLTIEGRDPYTVTRQDPDGVNEFCEHHDESAVWISAPPSSCISKDAAQSTPSSHHRHCPLLLPLLPSLSCLQSPHSSLAFLRTSCS